MCDKNVLIKGYQPGGRRRLQEGYQPVKTVQTGKGTIDVSTPVTTIKIIPPKGGTGEVKKK